MRSIRNILFPALLTLSAFTGITYTACNKDACKSVSCGANGTCSDGVCICKTGYEGAACETLTRTKFIGTWKGSDVCDSGTYTITLGITASSNDVTALISNPGGFGSSITITGNVSATNKLSFSEQSVGGGRTLTGTMTFDGSGMTFAYDVTAAVGGADHCNGTYTKQ